MNKIMKLTKFERCLFCIRSKFYGKQLCEGFRVKLTFDVVRLF